VESMRSLNAKRMPLFEIDFQALSLYTAISQQNLRRRQTPATTQQKLHFATASIKPELHKNIKRSKWYVVLRLCNAPLHCDSILGESPEGDQNAGRGHGLQEPCTSQPDGFR